MPSNRQHKWQNYRLEMNDLLKRTSGTPSERMNEWIRDQYLIQSLVETLGEAHIEILRKQGDDVQSGFNEVKGLLPERLINTMGAFGWMDRRGRLNSKGRALMAKVVRGQR